MSNTFFIGDLHLGHKRVVQFRPWTTVEEHDAAIIENWNSTVRKHDTVYVCGDVAFGSDAIQKLSLLNGTKKLIAGNHDTYSTATYLKYFTKVMGCAEVNGWLVTHIPVHESQFARWRLNIHGHTHSRAIDDPRYVCVSAEQTGYRPISVDEVSRLRPGI